MSSLPKPAAKGSKPAVEFMAVPTDGEGVYDAQRATWTEKRLAGIRKKMKEEAAEKREGGPMGLACKLAAIIVALVVAAAACGIDSSGLRIMSWHGGMAPDKRRTRA